jgi:hypothetical protein
VGVRVVRAEAGADAMLVACRLAGLSALKAHYADVNADAQSAKAVRNRAILRTKMRTSFSDAGGGSYR